MKKYVAICATLAALAWVGVAAAATPQGKLTGSATIAGTSTFAIRSAVIDGGMSYVGLENDRSGKCHGDDGTVALGRFTYNVFCAHFVASSGCCNMGSPKMRFAFQVSQISYRVVRITDNGDSTDTWAIGLASSFADARAWVNTGAIGSGNAGGWTFLTVAGNYTVTASQT
jgi:hypothetical protein